MTTTLQIFTDAHAYGNPVGSHAERKLVTLAPSILEGIITAGIERGGLDGVVDIGDLIEHSGSRGSIEELTQIDLQNFERALANFNRLTIPHLHAIGNHPVMHATEQAIAEVIGLSDKPYYSRVVGDHLVVMLHSRFTHKQDLDGGRIKSGSGIYIDQEQLTWLRSELQQSERPVLVCSHHPLSDQDLTGNVWFEKFPQCALMEDRLAVQEILAESGKVVAVLNGHTHWNYLTQDQYGLAHVTLQSLSENFRNDGTPARTYGIATLKDMSFNLEIFGNDLTLRGMPNNYAQITAQLASCYDGIAQVYADKTAQFGGPEREQFDSLLKMLRPGSSKVVIDFGCGPGRDVPHYENRGFKAIGVDVSGQFIDIARRSSPNHEFLNQDFVSANIETGTASIVIHNSSLQHVPRNALKDVLQKAFDVLEPGGIFYAHYRSGSGESLSISTEYGLPIARFIALYTEHEVEATLKEIGFEIIKSDTFDHKYKGLKGLTVKDKTRTYARKPGNPQA